MITKLPKIIFHIVFSACNNLDYLPVCRSQSNISDKISLYFYDRGHERNVAINSTCRNAGPLSYTHCEDNSDPFNFEFFHKKPGLLFTKR